jgi:outer membrane protein TolC
MIKIIKIAKLAVLSVVLLFGFNSVMAQNKSMTLSEALEKALENNYGIVISKSDIKIAEISNSWEAAGRFPTIGFTATPSYRNELVGENASTTVSGNLSLNWTLFNGFRVLITKDKFEKFEELAKGRSGVVVENTIQNVILAYYSILLQQEQFEVLNKLMLLSKDRYDYEQTKFEIGGSVTYNVLLAKNIYLEDKASYLNQEVVVKNAVRNFNFLLGEQLSQEWNFTEEFKSDTVEFILGDLMDKMMASNQTLKNQYINLMLQQEEIKLQKSTLYPRLNLNAGISNTYMWNNPEIPTSKNPVETLVPNGSVTLSYDIYSAGSRRRAIHIAQINEEIGTIETEEIKHSLTNQLYNEFETYNLRKELLNVSNESLEAAEMNLQIAKEKFDSGAINSFNYRDIQLNYLNSALNQLQSIYNLIYSNSSLTRLTGGFLNETE